MFNNQIQVPPLNWCDLAPSPFSVFYFTLLSTFPYRIQSYSLLQMQPPFSEHTARVFFDLN